MISVGFEIPLVIGLDPGKIYTEVDYTVLCLLQCLTS